MHNQSNTSTNVVILDQIHVERIYDNADLLNDMNKTICILTRHSFCALLLSPSGLLSIELVNQPAHVKTIILMQ